MFKADPKVIKEQIETLIQQEYMTRDEKDRTNLIYLPWMLASDADSMIRRNFYQKLFNKDKKLQVSNFSRLIRVYMRKSLEFFHMIGHNILTPSKAVSKITRF